MRGSGRLALCVGAFLIPGLSAAQMAVPAVGAARTGGARLAPGGTRKPALAEASRAARRTGGRFSIGLRLSRLWLEDSRRSGEDGWSNDNRSGNFLGSLWGLDPQQDHLPLPFAEGRVVSLVSLGVAYDRAQVMTLDWSDETRTRTAGDGDLWIEGLQTYVVVRQEDGAAIRPYLRLGYGLYWSDFRETADWSQGRARWFEVENPRGFLVAAGSRVALSRGFELDLSYEHLGLRAVKARARPGGARGAFPLRSNVLRLAVVRRF